MSNIDKRALREAAKKALNARARLDLMESVFDDDGDVTPEAQDDISICMSFNDLTNPATLLALLDELEAAEKCMAGLGNALCELLPGTQYMDPPDGGSVTPLEQVRRMVAEYRERIEELESRMVTVKLPADYRNSDSSINDDMFNTCEVVGAFREALAAVGIGVKGE
ncbi:ead/Ea22-like family protein [Citrobacter freundii]|nr:hypothetical protein [Citrobacter freundii]